MEAAPDTLHWTPGRTVISNCCSLIMSDGRDGLSKSWCVHMVSRAAPESRL